MKKLCLIFALFLMVNLNVKAEVIVKDDVLASTYIIGKYMYTRNQNDNYNGVLTTRKIMMASRTIDNELAEDDMIIYYKNAKGIWVDALTGNSLEVPNSFEIDKIDLIKTYQTLSPSIAPGVGSDYLSLVTSEPNVNNNAWEYPLEFNDSVHGSSKVSLKVDADFIRDEDTYYDITLEYYDEGDTEILLQVSTDLSNTPNYAVSGYGCYKEEAWCNWKSDVIYIRNIIHDLTNTNTWKTHIFRVNNSFFVKNVDNYIHLYFGMPENNGITNIKIKSITLTKRTFLINSIDANNENNAPMTGNVYNDSNFGLGFSIKNSSKIERNVQVSYRVLDNNNETIDTKNLGNISIGSDTIERFIDDNDFKYGIYKLCVTLNYNNITEEECFDFSKIVSVNSTNDFIGADILLSNDGWTTDSEIDANVDLLRLSGINQVRNFVGSNELSEDSSWINENFPIGRYTNTYQRLLNNNMRILTINKNVKVSDIVVIDSNHTLNDYLEDYSVTTSDGIFEGRRFKPEIFAMIKARAIADTEKVLAADTLFGNKIEYYELLNEWNFDSPYNSVSAEQYAEIAASMSEVIKEHNPNAKVVGIVSGDDIWNTYQVASYYSPLEADHLEFKTSSWIARVFATNIEDKNGNNRNFLSYIDAVSLHIYSYDDNKTPSQNYFDERVNGVRECIEYYLKENNINKVIPIIISETGYTAKASDAERANNTIKTLVWGQSKSGVPNNDLCSFNQTTGRPENCYTYIERIYLFSFQDSAKHYEVAGGTLNYQLYGDTPRLHYERDTSLSAKSAYVGLAMYNKMLAGATFDSSEINNSYTYYKYIKDGKTIIIIWNDDSSNVELSSLGIDNDITAYDLYGNQINVSGDNITVNVTPRYIVYE